MNPTIKDVAKYANVSIATVSRIVNGLPGYSEDTKKKVQEAIEALGYQPNAIARGLINKRTQTIGVLFPDVSGMLSSEVLEGVENAAHDAGFSVIVCNTASSGKRTVKYLRLLQEKRVDGIIFASEVVKEEYYKIFQEMKVPVVLVSTASSEFDLPFVRVNDFEGAFRATEYLITNGHKMIGMIGGKTNDPIAGIPRLKGFKEALQKHSLPYSEKHITISEGYRFQNGKESLPVLLKQLPNMTALFAVSDEVAIGAMTAAHQLGIKVPEELSIIGYDNLKFAEMCYPGLTTVSQPLKDMGQTAGEILVKLIKGEEKEAESRFMPFTIVERQSVCDLRNK
ncbi:LacI family DNA-binding transcriptional regulator [Fictibacillus phosphorivorans]|uniref:LacI family DNA-binding transcriptional regulator n=1 Tax=Fictibacillus phosphorivorans TaxID=1221500 RepID=UPI002041D8CC|nr:LacI family DNA-binding transcriptional regulator [Fictibacillus phosphorivorans]MCM3719285.1 LacI family transcriptional regulator [Fictibacillus phosphorivorans]MCM3776907.1 LacI family transcriptional regulator [Fictibacillus phosphorivorans]